MAAEGLPVQTSCRVLGISVSGFFQRRKRAPSARSVRHAWLTDAIRQVHLDSRGTYGARRVHAELTMGHGIAVGHNAVELLMRRAGLQGITGRPKFRRVANVATSSDLVTRDFGRSQANELWVTDITEHPTREGKVYCCVVLDAWSRRVVGWSIDSSPNAALVTNALGMAIDGRRPAEGTTVIHSDQGTQGGINRSSQHLDMEVPSGTTARLDGDAYRTPGDAFAGAAADPPRCGAQVLGEDRRGPLERRGSGRVWCVGAGGHQVVPRAWRHAIDPTHTAHGQEPVVR